jgi:hypothetical protein
MVKYLFFSKKLILKKKINPHFKFKPGNDLKTLLIPSINATNLKKPKKPKKFFLIYTALLLMNDLLIPVTFISKKSLNSNIKFNFIVSSLLDYKFSRELSLTIY